MGMVIMWHILIVLVLSKSQKEIKTFMGNENVAKKY